MALNTTVDIQDFDLLVIGWGSAGHQIALSCARAGMSTAMVEANPRRYGGSSINEACLPTKSLVESVRSFRASALINDGLATWTRAQDHARALSAAQRELSYGQLQDAGVQIFTGTAQFVAERTVQVLPEADQAEATLRAKNVVINTGSKPNIPSIKGIDNPRVLDSTQIQSVADRPRELTILGAGKIGLEFASIFSSLGTVVTVVDQVEKPLRDFDEEVTEEVLQTLEKSGVHFVNSARVIAFAQNAAGIVSLVQTEGESATKPLVSDYVLLAMGRKPTTHALDLAAGGVEADDTGAVVVDENLRTSVDGVWAVGDCKGGPMFTSVAFEDARLVLGQILDTPQGPAGTKPAERVIPTCTFLDPPLAQVGLSERAARQGGHQVVVKSGYIADLPISPLALIEDQTDGMIKFIVDADTDQILGATLFCVNAHELINTVALAMRCGLTATQLGQGIYVHPSVGELFKVLLGS